VLEGLEEVPWDELEHAYGRARDVPGQIRDLLSGSAEKRESALSELFGNIHHQGTLYSATAPAVPFLAEVARCEEAHPRVRIELLWLLAAIAAGGSDLSDTPPLKRARAARDAVRAELATLLPFVAAEDEATSLSAAALVAYFPEAAADSKPLVRARMAGFRDDRERRVLAAVLVLLGDRDDELIALVRSAPEEDADIEYSRVFPDDEPYFVLEDLLGAALRGRLPEHS
jgi:hypothetical protein